MEKHIFVVPLLMFLGKNLGRGNAASKTSGFVIILDTFCQVALEKGVHTPKVSLRRTLENTSQDHISKISADAIENRLAPIRTGVPHARLHSKCFTLTFSCIPCNNLNLLFIGKLRHSQ